MVRVRSTRATAGRVLLSALALALTLGACGAGPTPTPGPAGSPTPTPGPTPTPLLTLPPNYKLPRTWTVSFVALGVPKVTETYVLELTCKSGLCDAATTVLNASGKKIGSGTFRFVAGALVFESSADALADCQASSGTVRQGAKVTTTTQLTIASRREQGSAYVYVGLVGMRTIAVVPVTSNGCAAATTTYAARGEPR